MTPTEFVADLQAVLDDAESLEDLVAGWDLVKQLASELRTLGSRIEAELAARMESKRVELPGVGVLERHWAPARTKWDDPLVAAAVVDAAMEHQVHPKDALLRCAAVSYWRVGALKELGLDADRYRTTEGQGHHSVRVSRAA